MENIINDYNVNTEPQNQKNEGSIYEERQIVTIQQPEAPEMPENEETGQKSSKIYELLVKYQNIDFEKVKGILVNPEGEMFLSVEQAENQEGLTYKNLENKLLSELEEVLGLDKNKAIVVKDVLNSLLIGASSLEGKIQELNIDERSAPGKRLHLTDNEKDLIFEYWNECKETESKKDFAERINVGYPAVNKLIKDRE